jgi:hypothetical protein
MSQIGNKMVESEYEIYYIVSLIIMIIIGVALWLYADRIVLLMIGEDDGHININIEYDELLTIALKIIGIILALNAIPDVLKEVLNLCSTNLNGFDLNIRAMMLIKLTDPILRIVVGTILIIRKKQ